MYLPDICSADEGWPAYRAKSMIATASSTIAGFYVLPDRPLG